MLLQDFEWLNSLQAALASLAQQNIYLGTSSWKYPGWCGQLYQEDQYVWRGKFSETRFNKNCLTEYAGVFKSVCVDAGYYRFPSETYIDGLAKQVPDDFKFAFKVTDEITIKKFTRLPRFGKRAGKPNENFLNARLFQNAFLEPCRPHKEKIGLLIFEFSRFYKTDFERGRDFIDQLDDFLGALPTDWQYGVEIRNDNFLQPEYFSCLASHGVTHIFNSWDRMPPIGEQFAMPGSQTGDGFLGARLLLKPGRKYQEAVDMFSPYAEVKEPQEEVRQTAARMIRALGDTGTKPSFLFVNNRLEGNALQTIAAILKKADLL